MVQAAFSEDSHGGALLSGSKASVLIVDDSVVARGLFSRWVSEHPRLTVAGTAADGVNGIHAADRHKPAIIILDLDMPVMDGLTALPEILKVSPGPPAQAGEQPRPDHVADLPRGTDGPARGPD
jgi:CheY-like chemotaxis protein